MKKMFMAVLFALVSVNAMAADCAKGKIEFSKYNENDTFTVKGPGKNTGPVAGICNRYCKVLS